MRLVSILAGLDALPGLAPGTKGPLLHLAPGGLVLVGTSIAAVGGLRSGAPEWRLRRDVPRGWGRGTALLLAGLLPALDELALVSGGRSPPGEPWFAAWGEHLDADPTTGRLAVLRRGLWEDFSAAERARWTPLLFARLGGKELVVVARPR